MDLYLRHIPVSLGEALLFLPRNAQEQIISTDMMAVISRPVPIPNIRIKFECFPLFEVLDDEEGDARCVGAFIGGELARGAAKRDEKLYHGSSI